MRFLVLFILIAIGGLSQAAELKSPSNNSHTDKYGCEWAMAIGQPKDAREAFLATMKLTSQFNSRLEFQQLSRPVSIAGIWLPFSELIVETATTTAYEEESVIQSLPENLRKTFVRNVKGKNQFFIPLNPYNTRMDELGFTKVRKAEFVNVQWQVYPGNSRSFALASVLEPTSSLPDLLLPISLKMSTDHPHPSIEEHNDFCSKLNLGCSSHSLERGHYIDQVNELYRIEDGPLLLRETLAVFYKKFIPQKFYGFSIRDLSALADGHIYIPGTAVPEIRPDLLELMAALMGRTKAFMIVNYGITPDGAQTAFHGQQVALQLNLDGSPTGKISLQDLGDSSLVEPFAEEFPFYAEYADTDYMWKLPAMKKIEINSYEFLPREWLMDKRKEYLRRIFIKAFVEYVEKTLGVKIAVSKASDIVLYERATTDSFNEFFRSSAGQAALTRYRQKIKR